MQCLQSLDVIWVRYFGAFAFKNAYSEHWICRCALSNGAWMTIKQTANKHIENWVIMLSDWYIRYLQPFLSCLSCALSLKTHQTGARKRPGPHKQTGGDSLGRVNNHCFHGDGWDDWMAQIWCKQVDEFVEMESLKTQIAYWECRQHSHSVHSSQFVPCSLVTRVWWRLKNKCVNRKLDYEPLKNSQIFPFFHRNMDTFQQITRQQTEYEHMPPSKVMQLIKTSAS